MEETSGAQGLGELRTKGFAFLCFRYESPGTREVVESSKLLLRGEAGELNPVFIIHVRSWAE